MFWWQEYSPELFNSTIGVVIFSLRDCLDIFPRAQLLDPTLDFQPLQLSFAQLTN